MLNQLQSNKGGLFAFTQQDCCYWVKNSLITCQEKEDYLLFDFIL